MTTPQAPDLDRMAPSNGKLRYRLSGERRLEEAESVLHDWALILAEAGRDRESAEAMRMEASLLGFRCDFLESEKAP